MGPGHAAVRRRGGGVRPACPPDSRRAKQCWFNARRAVLRLDDYADAGYVEGLAVTREGLIVEHGWVVRGGLIVNPTLPSPVAAYFARLEFPGRAGIADFLATPLG